MRLKHFAASVAGAAATLITAPVMSQEVTVPMTKFFVAIPLDARNAKEQMPNFGLQFQGSRPYQTVTMDYKTFRLVPAAIAGGLELKYVIAGAVAVGAAVVATHKDKGTTQQFQQDQQQQKLACPTKTY
jgi:preprotein translocase subunit SecY